MKKYKFHTNIKKIDRKKWLRFYQNHSEYNPYQTFEMFDFWKKNKNCDPFIFLLEDNGGNCSAFCTGAIVFKGKGRVKFQSKSALIFGGPLINENEDINKILRVLLPKIEKYLRWKSKNIEFRNLKLNKEFKEVFSLYKWKYTPKVNYIVKLTNKEDVFSKFSKSKRTQIKKAYRTGIEISYDKTDENTMGVYKILKNIYKANFDEFLLPLPNLEFLMNLLSMDNAGITVIKYQGEIIAGEIFLMDDKTIYGWFGGGLNKKYKNQSPMSVSNWATIKYGTEKNFQFFDFGGAGIKGKENRLRIYKSAFGGNLIENGMFSKINLRILYKIENKIYKLTRKIVHFVFV